jgi:hypothetical protein
MEDRLPALISARPAPPPLTTEPSALSPGAVTGGPNRVMGGSGGRPDPGGFAPESGLPTDCPSCLLWVSSIVFSWHFFALPSQGPLKHGRPPRR